MHDFIAPIWKKALESAVMSGKAAVIHRKYRKRYRIIYTCRFIRQIRRAIVHFALYWNTVNVENKGRDKNVRHRVWNIASSIQSIYI